MIVVVSGVIVRNGRILLTQRPANKNYPYAWETPGGKLEGNEFFHGALRRELREELGIEALGLSDSPLWSGEVQCNGFEVFLLHYEVFEFSGKPVPQEGQGLGWFTFDEMAKLVLTPGNVLSRPSLAGRWPAQPIQATEGEVRK